MKQATDTASEAAWQIEYLAPGYGVECCVQVRRLHTEGGGEYQYRVQVPMHNWGAWMPAPTLFARKLRELTEINDALRRAISCEEGERDCAGVEPDEPGRLRSRCYNHQVQYWREQAEQLQHLLDVESRAG